MDAELLADFPIDEDRLFVRKAPVEEDRLLPPESAPVMFECVGRTSLDFAPLPVNPIVTEGDIDEPLVVDIGIDVELASNFPSKTPEEGC